MKLIQAKFIGTDSLGYKKNNVYLLVFRERGFWERFFDMHSNHKIEIWRANSKNVDFSKITYAGVVGLCWYSSMTTFLMNWDIVPENKLVLTMENMIQKRAES